MGSRVKYLNSAITKSVVNIFTEIPHAGTLDMKHIKQDFSLKAWVRSLLMDLGVEANAKIQSFPNMVMLCIKLKGTAQRE